MGRPKIYISGPISIGNKDEHLAKSCEIQHALITHGFAPLNPMLSIEAEKRGVLCDHETWMKVDLPWVRAADAVLRLPGVSKGADIEVREAQMSCVPVFYDLEALMAHFML